MIERKLIDSNITEKLITKYFTHYKTKAESKKRYKKDIINNNFLRNYDVLSKNDWELHKKLIKEGVNPNEIAQIIRNDEIEKLQEISSQTNFDFNQTIEPSLYERCSFINQENVTLIDYAAFFSSVKCFKYLLMNNANVNNTGIYAVAGGNEEIIHLCEQNHSSFEGAYETAIMFHRNDVLKYVYENKLEKMLEYDQQTIPHPSKRTNSNLCGNPGVKNINNLGYFCIKYWNYETIYFLEREIMKINEYIIDETARAGNLYLLVKHYLQDNKPPKNILVFASESGNIELVKYILEQKESILML